jgi:hypothetical protein
MTITQTVFVTLARLGVGFLVIVVAAVGTGSDKVAASELSPTASVTTLMGGWEQKFSVEWKAEAEPGGTQLIWGYVVSRYGRTAQPVRLLGQALDSSGGVVAQRIVWIPSGVPGFGRSYFEISHLPSADHFLVTVWDYSLLRSASSQ